MAETQVGVASNEEEDVAAVARAPICCSVHSCLDPGPAVEGGWVGDCVVTTTAGLSGLTTAAGLPELVPDEGTTPAPLAPRVAG